MDKIIVILMGLLFALGFTEAFSQDYHFETTSEGIIKRLSEPQKRSKSHVKTRALGKSSEQVKTRAVERIRAYRGKRILETVNMPVEQTDSYVNLKVEFDVNSYDLRSSSFSILKELGEALVSANLHNQSVTINGHTDSDGSEKYNLQLALSRALAVKQYLLNNFEISSDRLKIMGYGESMPLVPNTSSKNKQINRRVEVVTSD